MEYREALNRAAAECGVEPEYIDTWGRRHEPSEDALRAILASLGVPVESAEAIERYLETRAKAEWSRALDPAIVVWDNADSIPLRVPQTAAGSSVKLEIEWEGGELQHLWFWLPERPVLRHRKFAGREFLEKSLPLPKTLRLGYHRLRVYWVREPSLEQFGEARFIVGPEGAYTMKGRRAGVAVSLFGLRSARNWGVGDTTDLKALIDALAPRPGRTTP